MIITVKDLPIWFPFGMSIAVEVTRFGWNMTSGVECHPKKKYSTMLCGTARIRY